MITTRRMFLGASAAALTTLAAYSSQSGKGAGGLTLWTHNRGSKEELGVVNNAVKDFNVTNPNIPVTTKSFPRGSYDDIITSAAISGNLPDVLDFGGPIMSNWAWAGYLPPLTISQDLQGRIIDSAKGVWNNRLYSADPYDTSLCFLGRKSVSDRAGVTIPTVSKPWTKGEFMGTLDELSKLDGFNYAIDMSVWDTTKWWLYAYAPILQSFGGDPIDHKNYEIAEGLLDGDRAAEWGTWSRSLFISNYASQTPTKDDQDFLQGKMPLVYAGGWGVLKAQEAFGEGEVLILPPVDFDVDARVGGGSWRWGVSSSSKNADAVNKFIEFLMQDKYLVQYSDAIGNFPLIESATPKVKYYDEGKPLEPVYEIDKKYALLHPTAPRYKVILSTFGKATRDIVSGSDVKSTPDQAVKDINTDIRSNDGYKVK